MRSPFLHIALTALCVSSAAAQAPGGAHPVRVASVEGFTEYRLPNGLRVLLAPDSATATVTVNVTYMVGSRFEGYGEKGMAHLLEHLMFKGTTRRHNIYSELDVHGARWNATTASDRTNFFEVGPARTGEVQWMLDLEADRMVNSRIAKTDLASEMTVVRNEYEEGENDPFSVLLQRTVSAAYLWHNYGHSTIGARSDIENVPIERLQAFYRKYYQPDNALLVVAGKFSPAPTLAYIQATLGRIPKPVRSPAHGNVLYPTYTVEPTQDGERSVTLRRTGDGQIVIVVYHTPALSSPDYPAVAVLSRVLGINPSGRLYQALVDTKLAASTGAFAGPAREPGLLYCFAQVRDTGSLDAARTAMLGAVDETRTRTPTTEEVARAKTELLADIDRELRNTEQVGLGLSEWQAAGDWRLLFVHRDRLRQVTPADVQRVAQAYLKPSNATVGLFYPTAKPERSDIPPAPDVATLVNALTSDSTMAGGESFDPAPANIDARTRVVTLANHFRLSLLSKTTRGNTVHGYLALRFGTEQSLAGRQYALEMATRLLERGTTSLTRQQFKDSLDKLRANVQVGGGASSVIVLFDAVRATLPEVISLVADMVTHPRFDAKEFDALKQEELAGIESVKSEPDFLAANEYQRRSSPLPPAHPYYTPTPEEQIAALQALTLGETAGAYAEFAGAGAADLALVGDMDTAAVTRIATDRFGNWTSTQPYVRIKRPSRPVDSASVSIETPGKANATTFAGINVGIRDDDPDYPALLMGNYVLGGGALDSRLANRIRQKEGLSYSVESFVFARSTDSSAQWEAFATYAPQNAARFSAALNEEVRRVLRDGVTAEELQRAKAAWLQNRSQSRANDNELVRTIVARRDAGRTFAYDAQLEQRVQAVTPVQATAALRKYLQLDHLLTVRAGDFANGAAPSTPPGTAPRDNVPATATPPKQ
jgi:zinc protease